jgi:hypothetical protein
MYLRMKFKAHQKLCPQIARSQITEERMGTQITTPQIATFAEGPLIKIANLRFAELFADRPTLLPWSPPPASSLMNNEYVPLTSRVESAISSLPLSTRLKINTLHFR